MFTYCMDVHTIFLMLLFARLALSLAVPFDLYPMLITLIPDADISARATYQQFNLFSVFHEWTFYQQSIVYFVMTNPALFHVGLNV